MAKIRGNKYISVEERKALDDISEQRNADVSLGTKLYDLTNKLASEIEGEPISESFPKSVHDLEDHSTLPGIPSVTGLLDETAHDALDHAGLTGIPSVTGLLDETAHDALDHTGIEGCGGAAEVFTQEVHDLEDHSTLPGIPSVTGLLDETSHDVLDHTGLTGIPAEETFTEDVHAETSHDGIAGDLQWKAPVDDEASLPVNTPSTIHNFNLEPLIFPAFIAPGEPGAWDSFIANGFGTYSVVIMLNLYKKGKLRATIHADNDGVIGDLIATSLEEPYFSFPSNTNEEVTFNFGDLELINGEQYWVKIISVVDTGYDLKIRGCTVADNAESFYINNTLWDDYALCMDVISTVVLSYEADARYAKSEKTVNVFDGTTWNQVGLDETEHDLLDHTGLTGIPSVAGLLDETAHDALDHTGITGIILEIAETHEDLPTDGFYWAQGYGTAVGSKECNTSYDFADDFIGKGEHNYLFKLKHSDITNNTCTVEIHADNSGEPAAAVLHTLSHIINNPSGEIETEFDFGVLNLTDATTYWITISYNANSGTLRASSSGTSKEKFGEGAWSDHSGALAFALIITTLIENSTIYWDKEENVLYGANCINTAFKKLTIPVIEIPKDTMYKLDSQDLSAYLPADNSSGDMVALIPMSDEDFHFGIYANPIYIYMWRSNWAVPGWQLINPVLPTQGPEISYTNYSAPKGTMWLKEGNDGRFRLMYQGASGQGMIGSVSGTAVEDASGYNVWWDDLEDLQEYEPYYGYGAVHFVLEEKCLYYYDDDTDSENPVWVKLAPLQAANQAASTATTLEGLVSDFNALLTKLKNAGMMAADA